MKLSLALIISLLITCSFSSITHADTVVRGEVSGEWNLEGSPYIATGDINIPNREELRIEPGIEVRFSNDYAFLIFGKLEAIGTADDSISFIPTEEDEPWGGLRFFDADNLTRLDYCIISGGRAEQGEGHGDQTSSGGNIFINGGDVRIEHSRISHGHARGFGGGIAIWEASPVIQYCLINDNIGDQNGGGMEIIYSSSPVITECEFVSNTTGWAGGGVCIEQNSDPRFDRCTFRANQASMGGGLGLYAESSPTISHCNFIENLGNNGGGAAYLRNAGSRPLLEWCYFYRNRAIHGESRSGGAILIRDYVEAEVRYCRFVENQARIGGAITFWDPARSTIHHNLFLRNEAVAGGAISTSENMGDAPLHINNCTFIDNRGQPEGINVAFVPNGSRVRFSSCIIWGELNHFENARNVTVVYSNIYRGYEGIGNSEENPRLFEMDSTWCLLRGDSPCVDSGEPALPEDSDDSRNDRGWINFPHDAWEVLESDTLSAELTEGERIEVPFQFGNNTDVPFYVTPMDLWREGQREVMMNVTGLTGDHEITCASLVDDNFILAGGNSGRDPNRIYILDRDFNLRNSYNQPGGIDGDGFLDLTTDGADVIYASDNEQIIEFAIDGELGDQYEGPDAIDTYRAIGVDFNYPIENCDFYLGGDEGYIVRTNEEFWERERITVGETIRSLGVKGNSRALYCTSEPEPDLHFLSFVSPDDGTVTPLYRMTPPDPDARIGGIEIIQDFRPGRGSVIGIWKVPGDANDWLFVIDLYATWLAIFPEWYLLMPGEEVEWNITFAGDEVSAGRHRSSFFLVVNGYGEEGEVNASMRLLPSAVDLNPQIDPPSACRISYLYPNPFNSQIKVSYQVDRTAPTILKVIDRTGRQVEILHQGITLPGVYSTVWEANRYPAGMYFIQLRQSNSELISRKVVSVR